MGCFCCQKCLAKGNVVWVFMDLDKSFGSIDREGLWIVLIYGIYGRLLNEGKNLYVNS